MMDSQAIKNEILSDLVKKEEDAKEKQPELIENSPPIQNTQNDTENLKELFLTQKQLTNIKKDLDSMIDVMAQNPSLFSRAANFWGSLPLWQKIIAGIVIIVPTFLIAVLAHIMIFFAISAFSLVAYIASSFILDNHYSSITNTTDSLKAGISSLADVLGTVIQSLDKLHRDLVISLEEFQKENEKLAGKINELGGQVEILTLQTEKFRNTVQSLEETKNQLEQKATTLAGTVQEHTELLEKTRRQLEQAQKDYEASQSQLTEKIVELNQVKIDMTLEIEKTKLVAATLQAAVNSLTDSTITTEENRDAFKERLDEFLSNKEESFDKIAGHISDAERELVLVKDELNRTNQQYKELLGRQEPLVARLEALSKLNPTLDTKSKMEISALLSTLGIYAASGVTTPPLSQPVAEHINEPH